MYGTARDLAAYQSETGRAQYRGGIAPEVERLARGIALTEDPLLGGDVEQRVSGPRHVHLHLYARHRRQEATPLGQRRAPPSYRLLTTSSSKHADDGLGALQRGAAH